MKLGKGMMIWKIRDCEDGSPEAIASAAERAGFSHVLIKVADGPYRYNIHPQTKQDLAPALVAALKARNIQAWGWHYVYSTDPVGEAKIADQRVRELGLDGYVIDAEAEYKNRTRAAEIYAGELKRRLPSAVLVALSSYRFPSLHRELPWKALLKACNLVMPQVYWMKATNAGAQLRRSYAEYQALATGLPYVPTGAAFHEHGWTATPEQIREFEATVAELKLPGFNYWEWGHARRYGLWDAVSGQVSPPVIADPEEPKSESERVRCVHCGQLNGMDRLDCRTCGAPLPDHTPDPRGSGLCFEVDLPIVNLRSGPGTTYPIGGSLHKTDLVQALDVGGPNAWIQVSRTPELWACVNLNTLRLMELHKHA